MTYSFLTYDYQVLRRDLEGCGWRTPQTYCNKFSAAGDFPAVYLFLLVDIKETKAARPAYVGMSTRLAQRWSGHPILHELSGMNLWVQKWFLRQPKRDLRSVEAVNIERFDPPWNVNGRRRGVAAL